MLNSTRAKTLETSTPRFAVKAAIWGAILLLSAALLPGRTAPDEDELFLPVGQHIGESLAWPPAPATGSEEFFAPEDNPPPVTSDDIAVHQQIDAGLAFVGSTTDEKAEIVVVDGQRRRSERARRPVTSEERVDQAVAFESADGHLPRKRSPCRSRSKCLAGHLQSIGVERYRPE